MFIFSQTFIATEDGMTNDIHRLGPGSVPSFQGTHLVIPTHGLLSSKHKYHQIFQRNSPES